MKFGNATGTSPSRKIAIAIFPTAVLGQKFDKRRDD